MEKMVKLKLFKDNGQYKDDVFVAVNEMCIRDSPTIGG